MSGRRLETDGSAFEARDAWGAQSGMALCYFFALNGEAASLGDRGDRRAALEPGESLAEISEARLAELLNGAAPLTETERRFETSRGDHWLAQNIGPVWAEGVAAGLTGILFTALDGSGERLRTSGGPIVELARERLLELLTEARGGDDPGSQTPQ